MNISPITVRPPSSPEESITFFRQAQAAFENAPSEERVQSRQGSLINRPGFRREQLRAAFRDSQQVGGYIMHERLLRMGTARISTGCIGTVVTAPEFRKQGVASALMQDAIDFAQKHKHALLLLDGIPHFYYRYGYTDMFDVSAVEVHCSAILAHTPAAGYAVRPATVEDAAAMLTLYNRHCSAYTGSFERPLELQTYRLQTMQTRPALVLSPDGEVVGYLFHGTGSELAEGYEVTANSWEALLTLLHYHARLLEGDNPPQTLHYLLPLQAPMTQWMIDHLEVPDTSQWHSPAQEWGVRSLTYHHRFTGWMSRLISLFHLMQALLPELQARWQRSLAHWHGEIILAVAGERCTLRLNNATIQLVDNPGSTAASLALTPQAFVQWLFGYRTLSYLAAGTHLSEEVRSVLSILFPPGHTWLPNSDWF